MSSRRGRRGAAVVLYALVVVGQAAAQTGDEIRRLGESNDAAARGRLLGLLAAPDDATVDSAVFALARQREPRARDTVTRLGQTVANGLGGNATYEEARRLAAAAFYLLALSDETGPTGLAFLGLLASGDRADTAAWTMQTLCEHAAGRPVDRDAAQARRLALAEHFDEHAPGWRNLTRGVTPCRPPEGPRRGLPKGGRA